MFLFLLLCLLFLLTLVLLRAATALFHSLDSFQQLGIQILVRFTVTSFLFLLLLFFLLTLFHSCDVFIERLHLDRIVQDLLSVLRLPLLDGHQGVLQQLPLDVHLVTSLAGEDAGRCAVILHIIDLTHGALSIKILANLLTQEVLLSVDLTDRVVHPCCPLTLVTHDDDGYLFQL